MIGPEDMEEIVRRLLGDEQLPQVDILQLVQNLTAEADLDDDGMLSFAEFEHVISKSKEFKRYRSLYFNLPIKFNKCDIIVFFLFLDLLQYTFKISK